MNCIVFKARITNSDTHICLPRDQLIVLDEYLLGLLDFKSVS